MSVVYVVVPCAYKRITWGKLTWTWGNLWNRTSLLTNTTLILRLLHKTDSKQTKNHQEQWKI